MTERITSMPKRVACMQLPEQESGLVQDEMTQTLGGIIFLGPIIADIIIYAIYDSEIVDDCGDFISETWDSLNEELRHDIGHFETPTHQ